MEPKKKNKEKKYEWIFQRYKEKRKKIIEDNKVGGEMEKYWN